MQSDSIDYGVSMKDGDYAIVAFKFDVTRRIQPGDVPSMVSIIKCKQAADIKKLLAAGKPAQAQGKTYSRVTGKGTGAAREVTVGLYSPAERIIVVATEDQLEAVLGLDATKLALHPDVLTLIRHIGKSHLWLAAPMDQIKDHIPRDMDFKNQKSLVVLQPMLAKVLPESKSVGAVLKLEDKQLRLSAALACADVPSATLARATLQKFWNANKFQVAGLGAMVPPEAGAVVNEFISGLSFDNQNEFATVSVRFSFQALDGAVKAMQKASQQRPPLPPGAFPGPPNQPGQRRPRGAAPGSGS
jgi:hypothetical protein